MKKGIYLTEKYLEEQLECIRDIRASKRKFYQKITTCNFQIHSCLLLPDKLSGRIEYTKLKKIVIIISLVVKQNRYKECETAGIMGASMWPPC